jgi:TPR repeat protein
MKEVTTVELRWAINRAATLAVAQAQAEHSTSQDAAFAGMTAAAAAELGVNPSASIQDRQLSRALTLYLGAVALVSAMMRCRNEKDMKYVLQKAVDYGSEEPQADVTCAEGMGAPPDDTEAVKWIRLAAEHGCAEAQNALGAMCFEGRGVPQDDTEAVKWIRLAAEQGDAKAQNNLGAMYGKGKGVPQDDDAAMN